MSDNRFEYRIEGSDLQFVQLTLSPGAVAVGEPGSMMFMDDPVVMDTVLGDGANEDFFARIVGAFKRAFTGESMFSTLFKNPTTQPQRVAFAAPSPGKIIAIDLAENGGAIICQKGAFLGGTQGVRVGIAFKKRLRVGFFGGEGFIMQKLTGTGIAFIHASGTLSEQTLGPGESLKVDTGCLAALQTSATYDIRYVGKAKTAIFGGEGLFFAHLKGPGQVWLQSLPVQRLAKGLFAHAFSARGRSPLGRLYLIAIVIFVIASLFIEPRA
ncbi:MAG: TIGR00266 family protein [Pseudomonadota bacterium]